MPLKMMQTLKFIACVVFCLATTITRPTLALSRLEKMEKLLQKPHWRPLKSTYPNAQICDGPLSSVSIGELFAPCSSNDVTIVNESNVNDKVRQYYNLLTVIFGDVVYSHLRYFQKLKELHRIARARWSIRIEIVKLIRSCRKYFAMMDGALSVVGNLYRRRGAGEGEEEEEEEEDEEDEDEDEDEEEDDCYDDDEDEDLEEDDEEEDDDDDDDDEEWEQEGDRDDDDAPLLNRHLRLILRYLRSVTCDTDERDLFGELEINITSLGHFLRTNLAVVDWRRNMESDMDSIHGYVEELMMSNFSAEIRLWKSKSFLNIENLMFKMIFEEIGFQYNGRTGVTRLILN